MNCQCLPSQSATTLCVRCDAPLCSECALPLEGKTFCRECAGFVEARLKQRPTSTASVPGAPAAATSSADWRQDVYQGDVGQGEPNGLFVPPPPPAGDLYDPTASAATTTPSDSWQVSAGGIDVKGTGAGSPLLTLIFAVFGAVLGMAIWYFTGTWFEKNYGWVAIAVGTLTGLGAAIGSGGGSERAGLVAAVISVFAIVLANYMVVDDLNRKWVLEYVAENAEAREELESAASGGFSDREIRRYFEIPSEEWSYYDDEDVREMREMMRDELALLQDPETNSPGLSFGEFLSMELLRVKALVFLSLGVGAAWRAGLN